MTTVQTKVLMPEKKKKVTLAQVILVTIIMLFVLICVLPIINVASVSLSSKSAILRGDVAFLPVEPTINAYKAIVRDASMIRSLFYTIELTVIYTAMAMVMTILLAYPMTKKRLRGRRLLSLFVIFTMYFNGGAIPTYLTIKNYGLINSMWSLILPGLISTYNMIICRTYMTNSIPDEMYEAAQIDGCTPWKYFLSIVTPLCKPILAVLTLYYGVAKWNDYYTAMIYLRDDTLMPLTIVMKEILIQNKVDMTQIGDASNLAKLQGMSELLKYSTIVVASVPVMLLYPLVQKHLVKGVMIGAVKG